MKQIISCRAPTRRSQDTMSDTDEADTTKPGTDEAKAAHLSELTRPDIFIIGHRQARGIQPSIAGATDVPLHLPLHHHLIINYIKCMEKTRLQDDDHGSSLIRGGLRPCLTDVINREPSGAP
ncbi:unnamed protein product [Alopecurus aequalis]